MIRLMHKTQNRLTRVSAEAIGKLTKFVGFTIFEPICQQFTLNKLFYQGFLTLKS